MMMNTLIEVAEAENISLSERQRERINAFYELLMDRNRVMDLTNITEPREVAMRHMADSLFVLKCADFKGKKIIDIGTGAGFPSMPILMYDEDMDITMLDSTGKRIEFIKDCLEKIGGCKNAKAIAARAEEAALLKEHREKYDIVVSRAVANMAALSELCLPYLKKGGVFLAMKSDNESCDEEIRAAKKTIALLGGKIEKTINYQFAPDCPGRRIVTVKKIKNTPPSFPRKYARIKAGPPA